MAYSNWGAEVYLNGKPYPERCDVPVLKEPVAGYNKPGVVKYWEELIHLQKMGKLENHDWIDYPRHCVLGNSRVRLAGYKSYGEVWIDGKKTETLGWEEDWNPIRVEREIELDGEKYLIIVEGKENPERVHLELTEPDGTHWKGVSGYCMGEGHQEWY